MRSVLPDFSSSNSKEKLDIRVDVQEKTEKTYVFSIHILHPDGHRSQQTIGLKDTNYPLRHHEVWDTFLPLMYLSRNGGPLFNKPITRARVRASYPFHRKIVDFFERRAAAFGLELEVCGPQFDRTYAEPTQGHTVLFGGGKDSRLLLGTLREIGHDPAVFCARGQAYATDIAGAFNFEVCDFSMPNRIVPALMHLPRVVYHGCGLGEVHLNTPWQQYFDISAPDALRETSALLQSLGFDITILGPQAVLPYNLTQKILTHRYPNLAAGQISVTPHKASEKNLHVSLLKRYHRIATDDHCSPELFDSMLKKFMAKALNPELHQFGHHANREVIEREMRAIIFRLYHRNEIALPSEPPATWDAPWIDYVHGYLNPDVPPQLLSIYLEYADLWSTDFVGLPQCLAAFVSPTASGKSSARGPQPLSDPDL